MKRIRLNSELSSSKGTSKLVEGQAVNWLETCPILTSEKSIHKGFYTSGRKYKRSKMKMDK
jgi:hypothetical protein